MRGNRTTEKTEAQAEVGIHRLRKNSTFRTFKEPISENYYPLNAMWTTMTITLHMRGWRCKCGLKKKGKTKHYLASVVQRKYCALSPNDNQLDDPMILPMATSLQELHFVLHVIQFNNLWVFPRTSPFLVGLGWVRDTFPGTLLLRPYCEVDGGARSTFSGRCKPHPWN